MENRPEDEYLIHYIEGVVLAKQGEIQSAKQRLADIEAEMEEAKKKRKLHRMGLFSALAIGIHNFPEGLATFIGALQDPALGVSIAVAIAIHNIPEGIAVSVPLYYATGSRKKAFFYSFLSGLAEPLGGNVPSEGASCLFGPVFLGGRGLIPGSNGDPFVINAFYAGGTGARPGKDGLDCTAFPSGVKSTPVEITENSAPLIIWRKEFRPGSGGPGGYRGGVGQIMEFAHADGEAFAVSKMFDRVKHPPRGRQGGEPGEPAKVYVKDGATLRGMGREIIPAGGSMVLETAGGGGRGKPEDRDSESTARDQLKGLL